ncbi:hypothetical protein BJY04DRAFT_223162 [Aspergillus karnatakaensis]|uniref:uncharacterized protein n=1 Tax=Aspergillus karnatakaensis TaxID=1810916 RepID=UPI003CCD659F
MGAHFSQFLPPKPAFTEANLPSLQGKVFLITGGTSGIGFELAKILFNNGVRVYITARTEMKAFEAIKAIKSSSPRAISDNDDNDNDSGPGYIDFILLNLDDLSSIKDSANNFKAKESKIDVIWNNAGNFTTSPRQCLKTRLLLPLLQAASIGPNSQSPRVIWLSSQVAEFSSPPVGIIMQELENTPKDNVRNYVNSKVGNICLSAEFARRYGSSDTGQNPGIISVSLNPGAAMTNLLRNAKWMRFFSSPLLHDPKSAAYTELYAGLSDSISLERNGCYVVPFGRIHESLGEGLLNAMRGIEEGGTGRAKEFWEFCEERTREYL